MKFLRVPFLVLTVLLMACGHQQAQQYPEGFIHCEEPRPEFCTRDYRPVCGKRPIQCVTTPCNGDVDQTYGNACGACSDKAVVGYVPGECTNQ